MFDAKKKSLRTNANASTDLYEIEAVHTALMSNFLFALGGHARFLNRLPTVYKR